MRIPVYVINLESRRDRLSHVKNEMESIGLAFEVVPAIAARTVLGEDFLATRQSPGRVACWLSHNLAWTKAMASGADYALILEDDVRWLRDPVPILNGVSSLAADTFDVIQLGSLQRSLITEPRRAKLAYRAAKGLRFARVFSRRADTIERWLVNRSQLLARAVDDVWKAPILTESIRWGSFGSGTHAYLIGTGAIPDLLEFNKPCFLAADDAFASLAHQGTFRIGELIEPIVTQAPIVSDIR